MKSLILSSVAYMAFMLIASLLILSCGGCAVVKIHTAKWDASAYTFCKSYQIPPLQVNSTNGDVVTYGSLQSNVDIEKMMEALGMFLKAVGYVK